MLSLVAAGSLLRSPARSKSRSRWRMLRGCAKICPRKWWSDRTPGILESLGALWTAKAGDKAPRMDCRNVRRILLLYRARQIRPRREEGDMALRLRRSKGQAAGAPMGAHTGQPRDNLTKSGLERGHGQVARLNRPSSGKRHTARVPRRTAADCFFGERPGSGTERSGVASSV